MPTNPTLGTPRIQAPRPEIGDNRQALQGVAQAAQGAITRVHDNIIDDFREYINSAMDDVINNDDDLLRIENELAQTGTQTDADFSSRINLLLEAQRQGILSANDIMIRAESVVRSAQSRRPELAAELQREASLILGQNPIGAAQQVREQVRAARFASLEQERQAIADFAYDDLKIPRHIGFGSPQFVEEYYRRVKVWNVEQEQARYLTLLEQSNQIQAPENIRALRSRLFAPGEGILDTAIQPIYNMADTLHELTAQQRVDWAAGNLDIGFTPADIQANIANIKLGLQEYVTLNVDNPEIQEDAANIMSFVTDYVDQIGSAMADPEQDLEAVTRLNDFFRQDYVRSLPRGVREAAEFGEFAGVLLETAKGSVVGDIFREQVFDVVQSMTAGWLDLGRTGQIPITPAGLRRLTHDSNYAHMLASNSKYAGQDNREELAFRDQQIGYTQLLENVPLEGLNTDAMVFEVARQIAYLNATQGAPEELISNQVGIITNPKFLDAVLQASPEVRENTSSTLREFFSEEYSTFQQDLDREMRQTVLRKLPPRGRVASAPEFTVGDLIVPDLSDIANGNINFRVRNVDGLNPMRLNEVRQDADRWARHMSEYIKAQATYAAFDAGLSTPNYALTYNMLRAGGLEGAPLPLGDILPDANTE